MRYRGAGLAHAAVRCGALWRGQHRQPQACGYLFGDGVGQCPEPARRASDLQPDARAQVRGGLRYLRMLGRRIPRCLQRDRRRGPRDSRGRVRARVRHSPRDGDRCHVEACGILDQKETVLRAGGDPLTVGGAATWDGGVELGEDGFVAAGAGTDGAGDAPAGKPAAPAAGDAPAETPAAAKEAE